MIYYITRMRTNPVTSNVVFDDMDGVPLSVAVTTNVRFC